MSGFEVAGIVLGSVPIAIDALNHYRSSVDYLKSERSRVRTYWRLTKTTYRQYGLIIALLLNLLPGAYPSAERMEKALNTSHEELREFRKSLASNMNMVAVAVRPHSLSTHVL